MTVGADIELERALLADSLQAVGPEATAGCAHWTAFDLAAHVAAADRAAGTLTFCVRLLAARGVQFRPKRSFVESVIRRERRHGYPALIGRLRQRSPRLLLAPAVAASTLFEVWMHHDDLAVANGVAHDAPEHLAVAIPPLMRYQAKCLPDARLIVRADDAHQWAFGPKTGSIALVSGSAADIVRWLAGRRPITPPSIEAEDAVAEKLRRFIGTI